MKKRMVRIRLLGALVAFASLLMISFLPGDVLALGDSFVNMLFGTNGTHNHENMTAWTSDNSLPSQAGKYYLTNDVTISSTWNVPSGDVDLCLNGYGITLTGGGATVIRVNSGTTFTLDDCGNTTHYFTAPENGYGKATNIGNTDIGNQSSFEGGYITGGTSNTYEAGGGVHVADNASFVMKGGNIIGNGSNERENTRGGGVTVYYNSTFIMEGGAIMYNIVYNEGGGVFLKDTANMEMLGGTISHNYAKNGSGGIHIGGNSASFLMSDGEIAYNRAGTTGGEGGGMCAYYGTLTMTGGSIHHNSVGVNGQGGGVLYKENGNLIISGNASIVNNKSGDTLQDIYVNNKIIHIAGELTGSEPFCVTFHTPPTPDTPIVFTSGWANNMGNADPANYFVSSNANYVAYRSGNEVAIGIPPHIHGNVEFTAWTSASSLPASGNYYLENNVTVSATHSISGTLNLCLNGKTITKTGSGRVVNIPAGSTFNLYDEEGNAGKITGGFVGNGNGGCLEVLGTFNMYGGTITGNRVTRNNGNSGAGKGHGCALYVTNGGAFRMYGGVISGNTGVHGAVSFLNNSLGLITGSAKIVNNIGCQGIHTNGNDGVINLTVSGGEISGNAAGGVSVAGTAAGNVFNLSGNPLIYENSDYDLIVKGTRGININGELTNTQPIRVDVENSNRTLTSGWSEHMGSTSPANYLVAANDNYNISLSGNEAYIGPKHYHSWVYSVDGNIITATCEGVGTCDVGTQTLELVAMSKTYDKTPVVATVLRSKGWTEENGLIVPEVEYTGNTEVGKYTASVTVGEATAKWDFYITPIVLNVEADSQTKDYGEKDPALTYTVSGLLEGDKLTGMLSRAKGEDAGSYAIKKGTLDAGENYTIAFTGNYLTVNPIDATVTIVGNSGTFDYDGQSHTVSGYIATADTELYDVTKNIGFSGNTTTLTRTGAGTEYMGLTEEKFTNKSANFKTVTFKVTDGYLIIKPIDVTVTVVGNNDTVDYDGQSHAVTGYTATADTELYNVRGDFKFYGNDIILRTGVGTTYMGLSEESFANINGNFGKVKFIVTDGYLTVNSIDVTVTVTGNSTTLNYDGRTHYVSGYTAVSDKKIYDVNKFVKFTGTTSISRADAGTVYMGLTPDQFENINDNFGSVTFNVTDGYITVNPIDVEVTVTGKKATADYNGREHTASGYTAKASSNLYNVKTGFTFSGDAYAALTDAGTAYMGLKADQFVNTNSNFKTVTFNITDGYVTVNPIDVTVTVTGKKSVVNYNGKENTVTGYTATASNRLYNVKKDFTFTGNATASQTDAGIAYMELEAGQFANTNTNFKNVTFNVTDGCIEVKPITATVTVWGNNSVVSYNGKEHTVSGYTATADSNIYDVTKDIAFSGNATASQTDAGTAYMGLKADQFTNINSNFKTVKFSVVDGYIAVKPIDVTVTVTGNTGKADYDGKEHTVSGYTATADNGLYDVTKDIVFSGSAAASGKNAGTYKMGLTPAQFSNKNANFNTVEFVVTDGYVTVNKINAKVTVKGNTGEVDYDGKEHTVSGYTATADSELYDVTKDIAFSGNATVSGKNAGTYKMGLTPAKFSNTNANFNTVEFIVTDGYVTVNKINATVTVKGNTGEADYDGKVHSVNGYTATADSALYNVTKDITFRGNATASQTNAGTAYMGLEAAEFSNKNGNFKNVTFNVVDGYITVKPIDVTVTVKGNSLETVYNGSKHTVVGYTATADNTLYNTVKDITFSGNATVSQTIAGIAYMGLTPEQFSNKNSNFATVTFNVTDGYVTVRPTVVTVTIKGNTGEANYDGKEHTVSGYTATADSALYDVAKDIAFSGNATASGKNAGTYNMGITPEQFTNKNSNFKTVTFNVTDGYITVKPIDVTVSVKGNSDTLRYNGKVNTVSGYTATADSELYDVNNNIAFSGSAEASLKDVGTANMGLKAGQFANRNTNFATVTFLITDGYIKIVPVDAVMTVEPVSANPIYNGSNKKLIVAGEAPGGTLYYALGNDPKNVPDDAGFSTGIPTAKELGSYYVWYKVVADSNHNDIAPACIKVVLADKSWVKLSGTLYGSDGKTPLADSVVTLIKGNEETDYVYTDEEGNYEFIVPEGTYNIVANDHGVSATAMVKVFGDTRQDFITSGSKTQSSIQVNNDGNGSFGITVGGLNDEAYAIRKSENVADETNVSVLMTVERKSDNTAANTAAFSALMRRKSFMFFDVTLQKTIGSQTTVIDATSGIMEIAVPYPEINRKGISVYNADGQTLRTFKESSTGEDGTYRIDKENRVVYIYSRKFSTFAIGYIPYYNVKSTVSLGSFLGNVTVVLEGQDGEGNYRLENVKLSDISFADIPKGRYTMTVSWIDGIKNTLTMPLAVS